MKTILMFVLAFGVIYASEDEAARRIFAYLKVHDPQGR